MKRTLAALVAAGVVMGTLPLPAAAADNTVAQTEVAVLPAPTAADTEAPAAAADAAADPAAAAPAEPDIVYAMDNAVNNHGVAPASVVQTNAVEGWPQGRDIDCDFACLMDAATGVVLYGKNKDTSSPPASITKIMTCLVALEHGNLDDQVTMTEEGVALATDGSSNLYTQVGEVFTLRDMLYGMMLKSANDLATQIAYYVGGGSVESFVDMMNKKAVDLGCRGTHFVNPSGMPADGHLSTAYDMCLITQAALEEPLFRELIGTYQYTIPATNLTEARSFTNHHHWLETPADGVRGFIGGKTGYTDAALNTLVSVAEQKDMTLIAVTMHGNGSDVCLADTGYLFRYGFKYFEEIMLDGREDLARKGLVTVPVGTDPLTIDSTVTAEYVYPYGESIFTQFTWKGKKVGSAVLTKEAAEAREKAALESAAAAAESRAALSSAETAADTALNAPGETESYTVITPSPARKAVRVTLPLGITMDRTLFIIISVLSGLILLGIISIIITMIVRSE